jgi:hypothetical protein
MSGEDSTQQDGHAACDGPGKGEVLMKTPRWFHLVGTLGCLLAVFISLGGHWTILQTIAWGRMLADFSRHDSWTVAIDKTFSGKHPCPMCLQIRHGQEKEREQQNRQPLQRAEQLPEYIFEAKPVCAPKPALPDSVRTPFALELHTLFVAPPPKPPPRAA